MLQPNTTTDKQIMTTFLPPVTRERTNLAAMGQRSMSSMDLHRPAAYDDFGSHNDLRYGRSTPGPDTYQARVSDQDLYRGTRTPEPCHPTLPRQQQQRRRAPVDSWQHHHYHQQQGQQHDEDMFYDPYMSNSHHHSLPRHPHSRHNAGTIPTYLS